MLNDKAKIASFSVLLCRAVFLIGVIVSFIQYSQESRLPVTVYLLFGAVQLFSVLLQFVRRNFLTAIFGLCQTAILMYAALIEASPQLHFDATFNVNVYTPLLIQKAYNVLLFTTSLYHFFTISFMAKEEWDWKEPDVVEQKFARKFVIPFLILGFLCMLLTVRGSAITENSYASPEFETGGGPLSSGGVELLSMFFLVFSLIYAVRGWGYASSRYRALLVAVLGMVAYFRILRGDRASSLGVITTVALMYYLNSSHRRWVKVMTLSLGAIGLYIFFELWGHVRTDAANYGLWNAIETGWQYQIIDKFSGLWSGNSFDPLKVTLLPQSYWHLLHTIDLYHSNVSLDGTTFVDLILQSVPGFICDWLGFERPLNGAWRLAQYRIHGGGMYVIAEGYWNFGLLGSSIVALGLAFLVRYLETWYRKQEILIACTYFAFLGSFGFGVFYGLQPLVRAFQVALVSALIMKYIIRNYRIKQTLSYTRTRGVNFISALNRWYGDSDGI